MARRGGKDRGVVFKDQKWWVRYYVNGKEKWHRCESKSQGKALYGRLKADQREGKYFRKEPTIPFCVLAYEYEKAVEATRSGRRGDDRSRIALWTKALGEQDARSLMPEQVERIINKLLDQGRKPATVHRYFTVLKAILNRKSDLKQVRAEIVNRVRLPKFHNEIVRYLSPDQETMLINCLPHDYRPIVLLALNTGLRQGELLRIRLSHVDWHSGIISVPKTKSGRALRLPMNSIVQDLLHNLQTLKGDGFIFPFAGRHLRDVFSSAVKKAGLEPFRFHDLRHTFASRLAMQGANDRTIMALGGWRSPAMLTRYAHLSPTHLWKAVEELTLFRTGSKTGSDVPSNVAHDSEVIVN